MDRWVLSKLNILIENAHEAFAQYDIQRFMRDTEEFINRLSNWYVRRNRRRFWRERSDEDPNTLAAYQTLHTTLLTLCRLLAPVVPFITETMYRNLAHSRTDSMLESVHLCNFPESDRKAVDNELALSMDLAVDCVSAAHNIRKTKQIRVRQPLAKLIIATSDPNTRESLKRFEKDILDELNIKQLTFIDTISELGSYSVKPNFQVLGPRLGSAVKDVADELARKDSEETARKAHAGEPVTVTVAGQTYELEKEDLDIRFEAGEHMEVQETSDMIVAINTELDDDLKAEGMVRDVVRHIQVLRKERGFELEDRIVLSWSADSSFLAKAMETWKEYVMSETLAVEVKQAIEGEPQTYAETDSMKIALHVEKAEQD
jgi:isoleucyl-tRNA synthetase